jgi:hypothetical protein
MALTPAVMLAGAITLDQVRACTTDSGVPQDGALIAQTADGVLVALEVGEMQSVMSVPGDRIGRITFGERALGTSCPPPSIAGS